ncbi:high mobility group protein D-like [Anticarsia gemmatalis]|uniref:high mobility group protein D-like n=1 Tax=Anticarsia gemmatalis TaxID=129554 RepID=UPI003F76AC84
MMEKPKRPMSAYLLWLNSTRAQIKADHPGLKVTEVAKKAGELWRAMEDKSTWEQRAAEAKEQYTQDLEAFNATEPLAKRGVKRGGKPRAPAQPKPKKERAKPKKPESEDEADDDGLDDDEPGDSE